MLFLMPFGRFICLVTDFAIFDCPAPISLLGAAMCFFNRAPYKMLFESKDETLLPLEEPKEHFSQPISPCFLHCPLDLKF